MKLDWHSLRLWNYARAGLGKRGISHGQIYQLQTLEAVMIAADVSPTSIWHGASTWPLMLISDAWKMFSGFRRFAQHANGKHQRCTPSTVICKSGIVFFLSCVGVGIIPPSILLVGPRMTS